MKTPILPLLVTALLAVPFGAVSVKAQGTDAPPSVPSSQTCKKGGHHKTFANLSAAERHQLKSAMNSIKDDPQLVAARQAIKDAQTREARMAAKKEAHRLRRELLLKADPSLGPILEKIQTANIQPATSSQ